VENQTAKRYTLEEGLVLAYNERGWVLLRNGEEPIGSDLHQENLRIPYKEHNSLLEANLKLSWTAQKKSITKNVSGKRALIELSHPHISVRRQCELIGLNRSSLYYGGKEQKDNKPATENQENLMYMKLVDKQYTKTPFYGSRQMRNHLRLSGYKVNRKRVRRLMRLMGLEAIYPRPRTSIPNKEHRIYPYLLRNLEITRVNQVWSTDITYIPIRGGFMYLAAIIDLYSRYVLSWRLSNTMDVNFCLEALEDALKIATPEIFNTDQGSQFTSSAFTGRLEKAEIKISMDGRGRAFDNIFAERLWRSLKYEDIYL